MGGCMGEKGATSSKVHYWGFHTECLDLTPPQPQGSSGRKQRPSRWQRQEQRVLSWYLWLWKLLKVSGLLYIFLNHSAKAFLLLTGFPRMVPRFLRCNLCHHSKQAGIYASWTHNSSLSSAPSLISGNQQQQQQKMIQSVILTCKMHIIITVLWRTYAKVRAMKSESQRRASLEPQVFHLHWDVAWASESFVWKLACFLD